jgi:hypothetical protein
MHKSNATYYADLDVSRSHILMYLLRPGMAAMTRNNLTRLVRDKEGNWVKGAFGLGLGAVCCTFKKELGVYQKYEMWTRILAWDRKWLYLVTHFVVAGKVKPPKWDDGRGPDRGAAKTGSQTSSDSHATGTHAAAGPALPSDLSKYVIATAISKYVFKMGRFTVHPTILLEASDMLPPRDGGWRGGPGDVRMDEDLGDVDPDQGLWDWRKTELERRRGMEFAQHFGALDEMTSLFDGGKDGALAKFTLG